MSEGSMEEFSRKMEFLEYLCRWKNGIDVKLERSEESSERAGMKCAGEISTDCSVNLLESNHEPSSDEDADDISPDVSSSTPKIGTPVDMQIEDLQVELTNFYGKDCGQPLLAKGTTEENGETTTSQQYIHLPGNDVAPATKLLPGSDQAPDTNLHGTTTTLPTSALREIKVPPPIKKCGRPKGLYTDRNRPSEKESHLRASPFQIAFNEGKEKNYLELACRRRKSKSCNAR